MALPTDDTMMLLTGRLQKSEKTTKDKTFLVKHVYVAGRDILSQGST
jgi:hypothetical protein